MQTTVWGMIESSGESGSSAGRLSASNIPANPTHINSQYKVKSGIKSRERGRDKTIVINDTHFVNRVS
jgi:hypothetical protein